MIKALVGLGNIGKEYESTYHNVGVFVAQEIAKLASAEGKSLKVYEPVGYMNVSGLPVAAWMKQGNLQINEIIVAHDESDLPIGEYKISHGGGSAGHNGIASLIEHLHTEEFARLRVGIRDPKEVIRKKAGEFVLTTWSKAEEAAFMDVAKKAWNQIKDLVL